MYVQRDISYSNILFGKIFNMADSSLIYDDFGYKYVWETKQHLRSCEKPYDLKSSNERK